MGSYMLGITIIIAHTKYGLITYLESWIKSLRVWVSLSLSSKLTFTFSVPTPDTPSFLIPSHR